MSRKGTPLAPGQIYSQPANTGTGTHESARLAYAVECLKGERHPVSLDDFVIRNGLDSLLQIPSLLERFRNHERVLHHEKTDTWSYKPDFDLRSPSDLLALLKARVQDSTPGGLSVGMKLSELRESYGQAKDAVEEFAKVQPTENRQVLVLRGQKDHSIKHVYWNEVQGPEAKPVDAEFRQMWHEQKVPDEVDLPRELEQEGLRTAQQGESTAPTAGARGGKRGRGRGRGTGARKIRLQNTHLDGVDFSTDYRAP